MLDKSKRVKIEETKAYLTEQKAIAEKNMFVLEKLINADSLDEMIRIVSENEPYEKGDSVKKIDEIVRNTIKELID